MRRFSAGLLTVALLSTTTMAAMSAGIDAPEISRSRGAKGTIVVLWPRIIPADDDPETQQMARAVQEKLATLAHATYPDLDIDVRPSPERVCPMGGCDGAAIGALLVRREDGCAVIALLSRPGSVPMSLVPWAGDVRLRATQVPFRQHPENWVTVTDFAPCVEISTVLESNQAAVIKGIRRIAE